MSAPAFDPSRPFEKLAVAVPPFDPSQPFEPADDSGQHERSAAFAALKGVQDIPTMGWGDELGGAVQAGAAALAKAAPGLADALGIETRYQADLPSAGQAYIQGRDENRVESKEAAAQHPLPYYGAGIAASLPLAKVMPMVEAGPGAGLLAKVGAGAATGVMQGAVAGAGQSEADSAGGVALDALKGAGAGGALGAAMPAVGAGLKAAAPAVADKLQRLANISAVKAAGGIQKDLRAMGPEDVQALGQRLIDEGIIGPFSSRDDILKAVTERLEGAGGRIDAALKAADAAAPGGADVYGIAQRISNDVLAPNAQNPLRLKLAKEAAGQLGELAPGTPFEALNQVKSDFAGPLYNRAEAPLKMQMGRQVGRALRQELEEQVGLAAGPEVLGELQSANRLYGAMAEAKDLAEQGVARESGNNPLSLRASMGLAAAATGHPMGLVYAAGQEAARRYGSSAAAWGASKGAELVRQLAKTDVSALGRLIGPARAAVLARALAEGGDEQFAVSHFVLAQTDPGYSQVIAQMEQGKGTPGAHSASP